MKVENKSRIFCTTSSIDSLHMSEVFDSETDVESRSGLGEWRGGTMYFVDAGRSRLTQIRDMVRFVLC